MIDARQYQALCPTASPVVAACVPAYYYWWFRSPV